MYGHINYMYKFVKRGVRRGGGRAKRHPDRENCFDMPIYEDIARDLLEAIHRGQYPIGGLITTELELAARYEVGRPTVRAAMRRLTELGAGLRRKRYRPRVGARERPEAGLQQTPRPF